jgi:hypothetical protein
MSIPAASVVPALRDVPLLSRAIVEALLLCAGPIGSADEVANRLCLRNRFALARMLKTAGLPPLHELAGWAKVLTWVDEAERTGNSLCQLAFRSRCDPAACYRLVKRITGLHWRDIHRHGTCWVVGRFLDRCVSRSHPSMPQKRPSPAAH